MKVKQYNQNRNIMISRKGIFFSLFVCVCLLIGAFFVSQKSESKITGFLSGLKPGAQVTYRIVTTDDKVTQASAKVSEDGTVSIPGHVPYANGGVLEHYSIRVEQGKNAFNIGFRLDPEAQTVSVKGEGLENFELVEVESGSQKTKTKADWSGSFKALDAAPLKNIFHSDGIQLALLGSGEMNGMGAQNPLIIKIFDATGGGERDDDGVNEFTKTYCHAQEESVDHSVCDETTFQDQIDRITEYYTTALIMMGEQLSAVMLQHVGQIGMFFDAKTMLETERTFQEMTAQAHKDYHPSDQMCRFGSYVRSVGKAEEKGALDKVALSKILSAVYLGTEYTRSAKGYAISMDSRLKQFREVYCDPRDNNGGLDYMCYHNQEAQSGPTGAVDKGRMNKDLNFGYTLDLPNTLNVDFTNNVIEPDETDEEDVVALGINLYWPKAPDPVKKRDIADRASEYQKARSLYALNNLAHNSYANYVALKARSHPGAKSGWKNMKAMLLEMGVSAPEVEEFLGEYPSYYAQMEVLTKKIYQDPDFYSHLYDKPANLKRISVAMEAIKLMQARDFFDSTLRRELLTSVWLDQAIIERQNSIEDSISELSVRGR